MMPGLFGRTGVSGGAQDYILGNSTEYTTILGPSPNYIVGQRFPLPEAGKIKSIHLYGRSPDAGSYVRLGIYDNASPNRNLICETAELNLLYASPIWIAGNINPEVQIPPGDYWIVLIHNLSCHLYTDGSGLNPYYISQAYGAFPNPNVGALTAWNQCANMSIYATYTK